MRLRAWSKWSAVPATALLLLAAGVWLYHPQCPQPLDNPPGSSTSADPGVPAGPNSVGVASLPVGAPASEIVGTNDVEAPHPPLQGESVAVEMAPPAMRPPPMSEIPPIGYAIRGKVMSKDGPVRDDEPGQWLSVTVSAPSISRRCEIDEQGSFECAQLDAGSYLVSIADRVKPHRLVCRAVEVLLDARTPTSDVVFVLGDEVPVAVVVLGNESLEAVSDCPVVAQLVDGTGSAVAQTDRQGCCVLSLIPGRYRVYANWDESTAKTIVVSVSARGLAVDLRVPAPPVLEPRMIRGVLVDSQGNRVKGYVDLGLVARDPNSGPADSFCLPQPEYIPPDGLIGCACDVSGRLARRFVRRRDAPDEELVVVLVPRAGIVGRLVGIDGRSIPDAQADLEVAPVDEHWRAADDSLYTLVMDGAGGFQVGGLAVGLKVRVTAYRAQSNLLGRSAVLDLKPGETRDAGAIVLKPPQALTGILRGRITNEHGEPIVNRNVRIWAEPASSLGTDDEGYFTLQRLPTDEPVTVTAMIPGYGKWSRMTTAGDLDCNFQVYPSGWGIVGEEPPPLVVDRWFNHAPVTLEELRGRVVLLMFCSLREHPRPADAALSSIRVLDRQYRSQGLMTIAVYNHLSGDDPPATNITEYLLRQFGGLPIAGCFDADPNPMADLMPKDRPVAAVGGVTHWRYRVCSQPICFLIDKQGKVRYCIETKDLWDRVGSLLAE